MKTKRGRPPIHRKAMTAAQRQARHRLKVKGQRQRYQPPPGYYDAKAKLIEQRHEFERARREWGHEEGVFVDGAFMSSNEVIRLSKLSGSEARIRIAQIRVETKSDACGMVAAYMELMHVSFEELVRSFGKKLRGFSAVPITATPSACDFP
jgi:hypothetical protein